MKTALAALGLALILGTPVATDAGQAESNFWMLQKMWAEIRAEKERAAANEATDDRATPRTATGAEPAAATGTASQPSQPTPKPVSN